MPDLASIPDWIGTAIVGALFAVIGYVVKLLQDRYRNRAFLNIIIRELEEISPYPIKPVQNLHWWDHQQKDFVHRKIFDEPSNNKEFLFSLPPDIVYFVSQLWSAKVQHNDAQWLYYLEKLSDPKYDKRGRIKTAHQNWITLINEYNNLETHR